MIDLDSLPMRRKPVELTEKQRAGLSEYFYHLGLSDDAVKYLFHCISVGPYMTEPVIITGGHCTGKDTLRRILAVLGVPAIVPENLIAVDCRRQITDNERQENYDIDLLVRLGLNTTSVQYVNNTLIRKKDGGNVFV